MIGRLWMGAALLLAQPVLACKPSQQDLASGAIPTCPELSLLHAETVTLLMPVGTRKLRAEDQLAVLDRRLALVRFRGAGRFCAAVQLPVTAPSTDVRRGVLEQFLRASRFNVVDALEKPLFGVAPDGDEVHVRIERCGPMEEKGD